jgi:hypothetical protein
LFSSFLCQQCIIDFFPLSSWLPVILFFLLHLSFLDHTPKCFFFLPMFIRREPSLFKTH